MLPLHKVIAWIQELARADCHVVIEQIRDLGQFQRCACFGSFQFKLQFAFEQQAVTHLPEKDGIEGSRERRIGVARVRWQRLGGTVSAARGHEGCGAITREEHLCAAGKGVFGHLLYLFEFLVEFVQSLIGFRLARSALLLEVFHLGFDVGPLLRGSVF